MNRVFLVGRLGCDVEIKYSAGGTAIASWRMATGRKYKNRDGKEIDGTQWHRVKAFGKTAETAHTYLHKGSEVAVEGRIETSSYEKDGEKRYSTEIVCEQLKLIGGKGGIASQDAPPDEPPAGLGNDPGDALPF
jgi:single-strand DNA-binding protein